MDWYAEVMKYLDEEEKKKQTSSTPFEQMVSGVRLAKDISQYKPTPTIPSIATTGGTVGGGLGVTSAMPSIATTGGTVGGGLSGMGGGLAGSAAAPAAAGGAGAGAASGCCFIFLEVDMLTDAVRKVRDELFRPDSYVAKGYLKTAKFLVPLMRKSRMIKGMVKVFMTHPIAVFCERKNPVLIPVCLFWCLTWELYGRVGGINGDSI